MKRFLIITGLSLLLGQATAQIPIPFLDSCFVYQRVLTLDDSAIRYWDMYSVPPNGYITYYDGADGPYPTIFYNSIGDCLFYIPHFEEYGTRIYGIATCSQTDQIPPTVGLGIYDRDYQLLASVAGDEPHYCKNMAYTYVSDHGSIEHNIPCQIHLFNDPVILPDTFFLGMYSTIGGDKHDVHRECLQSNYLYYHLLINRVTFVLEPNNSTPWVAAGPYWGGYFPIRELPCPVGPEPNLVASLSGQTVLGWQAGDTTLYLLDFFDEDGHLLFESDTLSQTGYVLTDSLLDAAGYHESGNLDVRLRRACSYMASSYHTVVWSPWSAPRRFYHQRGVEGLEGVALPELTVSPNPATGMLHVEGEAGQLQLLDLQGREVPIKAVRQSGNQPTIIDVSALLRGVYLLRLTTALGTASRRVVLM